MTEAAAQWSRNGTTPVHLALAGRHIAALALADPIRDTSTEAVGQLHDLALTARAVGAVIGIDTAHGGLRPDDKLAAIRALGDGCVFVEDGINDAPALVPAQTGTDIAIKAADAVLIQSDPRAVAQAVRLSRAIMANIRQNLFWAFAYNSVLVPVAMGALVPFGRPRLWPVLGAGAMALSSMLVVLNALRLRHVR